ncbi:MAG TPA: hypothetical protein DCR48_01815 [Flavobacteriales bacterium]|jgi:uncharacterized coiled-coil protein SlyX|nr:hypothetical protein [Salibacteraceae bacterium]HAQ69689.1 hypothetical protein [Flavobacteriales bacterium]
MKTVAAILYIAFLTVSITSCNSATKKERLERIDSLGIHLNYVEETIAELDSVLIENRIADINQTNQWLGDNITDTLARVEGIAIGDFFRTGKFLGQAKSRYNEVSKELRFSKKQLETLRNDVKNSFYSEEEFSGYFNTESQSIAKLVDATDELKSKYEMSDTRFTKFKPLAKGIIDSIKTVIYGSEPVSK